MRICVTDVVSEELECFLEDFEDRFWLELPPVNTASTKASFAWKDVLDAGDGRTFSRCFERSVRCLDLDVALGLRGFTSEPTGSFELNICRRRFEISLADFLGDISARGEVRGGVMN